MQSYSFSNQWTSGLLDEEGSEPTLFSTNKFWDFIFSQLTYLLKTSTACSQKYNDLHIFSALKYAVKTSISFKRKSLTIRSVPVGSSMLESSSKRVYYEDLPVPWVLELELTPKF